MYDLKKIVLKIIYVTVAFGVLKRKGKKTQNVNVIDQNKHWICNGLNN